jgi:hypothetical protein
VSRPVTRVRRTLAHAAVREIAPRPRGPLADEAALRAPGLLLGFPLTPAGGVAGGANDDVADAPVPVLLTLTEVNARFKRQSSLAGAAHAARGSPLRD